MQCPEPGIYHNIPDDEYRSWDAMCQSTLKVGRRSMAHLKASIDHPREQTDAMRLGSLTHAYILEPAEVLAKYVVAPKCDRRTKAGKEEWSEFQQSLPDGAVIVGADELQAARAMRDSVRTHGIAGTLIRGCDTEVACVWMDRLTGVLCKARIDVLGEEHLADVKTCLDASPLSFPRDIGKWGYHFQAAFYVDGVAANIGGICLPFYLIAVEKSPPYAVQVYEIDPEDMAAGEEQYQSLMHEYAECKRLDVWPGYTEVVRVAQLPPWVRNPRETPSYVIEEF
jgi:hypothetical protein